MERTDAWRWAKEIVILVVAVAIAVVLALAVVAPRVRANRRGLEEGQRLESQARRLEDEIGRAKLRLQAYRDDPWFRQEIRFRELGGRQ
ncbi:MAG: hypothetical protein JXP34_09340 [Planctomycetes bacterium]|nr:hypothetical protein [Planctomycetota bacterium]